MLLFQGLLPALWLGPPASVPAPRLAAATMQMQPVPFGSAPVDTARMVQPTKASAPKPDSSMLVQLVQGGGLRTWSYRSPTVDQVQVVLSTEGSPLDADIQHWHGPDHTPCKMKVYGQNGKLRPFQAVLETPRSPNTVAIRNHGQVDDIVAANVLADNIDEPSPKCLASSVTLQGGALRLYPFDEWVDSVQVLLKTDGRPLNARIELLQGPNNNKQVIELYTEDGRDRPFFCVLETPGPGNVVRSHVSNPNPNPNPNPIALTLTRGWPV